MPRGSSRPIMPYELIPFASSAELAIEVARRLRHRIRAAARSSSTLRLAISGGRISNQLFESLTALESADREADRSDWNAVEFFWTDERCVPPDHPDSNFGAAAMRLLRPLGILPERIHRIEGELAPELAAGRASERLEDGAPLDLSGAPRLDLILLGMGEDGHIASLFPNAEPAVVESGAWFLPVIGPKPPPRRVSMSYRLLKSGREVWVLVSGEGKEIALRNSLGNGRITPLGHLLEASFATIFSSVRLESEVGEVPN